jgi:hypothetical protein
MKWQIKCNLEGWTNRRLFVVVLARNFASSPFLFRPTYGTFRLSERQREYRFTCIFSFFRLFNSVSEPDSLCPDPDPAFYLKAVLIQIQLEEKLKLKKIDILWVILPNWI